MTAGRKPRPLQVLADERYRVVIEIGIASTREQAEWIIEQALGSRFAVFSSFYRSDTDKVYSLLTRDMFEIQRA